MVKRADEVLKDLCFMVVVILVLTFVGYCFAEVEYTYEKLDNNTVKIIKTETIV